MRLGEGLGLGNRLSDDAIERTIDALRVCRDKMAAKDVARARLVATEACRLAENGPAFIERVRDELDLELEIVDRKTEAYLAVTGCASLVDPKAHSVIVFDIGGGSTEIAWLDGRAPHAFADPCKRIRAWDSLPVGVVTLAERHGGIDVTPRELRGHGRGGVPSFCSISPSWPPRPGGAHNFHLLGTSGTVTTVGGIHLGLARYDRRRVDGMWMRNGEISTVMRSPAAFRFQAAGRESLHRQGTGRSGSGGLRHFGSDPPGLPVGPPAHRGSRTARRNFDEHDARGFACGEEAAQR